MLKYILSDLIVKNGHSYYIQDKAMIGRSAPPLPLDMETFNWLYIENNEVKYTEVPVAVIHCDSVSWDGFGNTRNNNGYGSKNKPFKNLNNAFAQARYWVKNFCNLRVLIKVTGVLDYGIGDWRDRPYNAKNIVFDFSQCEIKNRRSDSSDYKHLNIYNAYFVGLKNPVNIYTEREYLITEKPVTLYDKCEFIYKPEDNIVLFFVDRAYDIVVCNSKFSVGGFTCNSTDENNNGAKGQVFNSNITLTNKYTTFNVDRAVNCNITCASSVESAKVRGELINCTENFPD